MHLIVYCLLASSCAWQDNSAPATTTQPAGAATVRTVPTVRPQVAYEDLVLITRYARRAMEDRLLDRPEQGAIYQPPALREMRGIVRATLRHTDTVVASAESAVMPVAEAAVAAGTLLGQAVLDAKAQVPAGGIIHGLEIEWLGPPDYLQVQPFGEGGTWTEALIDSFEPAVHGMGVEFRGKRGWTRPAEVIEAHLTPDVALAGAEQKVGLRHIQKVRAPSEIRYFRFWTYHLWQPSARSLPVVLDRGAKMLLLEDVTESGLNEAIKRLGAHLASRRLPAGSFSHEYLPGKGKVHEGNSAIVQLRALSGLAMYATWRADADLAARVKESVQQFQKYVEPLELKQTDETGREERVAAGHVLVPPGHPDTLDLTAELLRTLVACPQAMGDATLRDGLVDGILASQEDSGRLYLDVAAKQVVEADAQPREEADQAGRALFALTQAYGSAKDAQIERVVLRALPYYHQWLRKNARPEAAALLARAFARQYQHGSDARLSDFVFEVADGLVAVQLDERSCLYPELYGAINVRKPGLIGADTSLYLSVLCDAAALAKRIGDRERAERYASAARKAVRFVLQLQVTPPGDYYMPRPEEALGGIRNAPWDHRIRVDYCGEALEALILAGKVLHSAGE